MKLIDALSDAVSDALSDAVKAIIANDRGATINEIMNAIGKSNATAKRYLQILKTIDLIEFKGAAKTGKYFITPIALAKMKNKK
jgi:DNA-binding IclR family transcriptional regulator